MWTVAAAAAGAAVAGSYSPAAAQTQSSRVSPERQLLGIRLGRSFQEVFRRFGKPSEVITVALSNPQDNLPGVGGAGAAGMPGSGGFPGMGAMGMGGMGAMSGMGGGGELGSGGMGAMMGAYMAQSGAGAGGAGLPMSGGMGSSGMGAMMGGGSNPYAAMMGGGSGGMMGGGSNPYAAMMGGGSGGMMGGGSNPYAAMMGGGSGAPAMSGMPGMPGMGAAGAAGQGNMPEYSSALLWVYKRSKNLRYEFLMNEDGRVAQISIAAPKNVKAAGVSTSRGVTLGSSYDRVLRIYGYPETTRMLPGMQFMEAYFTRKYHTAFTFDTETMQVVRITIALAD